MNSPFSTLFLAMQERITTMIPGIRWIDMDMNQLEIENPPVSFPCCLIDFDDTSYEDMGEGGQFADALVGLRLGFAPFSQTSNVTPILWKEKGLAYFDLEWQLHKIFHGWKAPNYGYLMRVRVATEKERPDVLRVRKIFFKITYEDYGATPQYGSGELPDGFVVEVLPN